MKCVRDIAMRPDKTSRLIIRIEPELHQRAMRVARSEGESLSSVVRRLLRRYIASRGGRE